MRSSWMAVLVAAIAGCGGGSSPIELTIEFAPAVTTSNATIVLSGRTFIPAGSTCPGGNEFIKIGSFGASTITVRHGTTGLVTPGFLQSPWVCNDGEEAVAWASNPITLSTGANALTVTMSDSQRSSSATITVTRN